MESQGWRVAIAMDGTHLLGCGVDPMRKCRRWEERGPAERTFNVVRWMLRLLKGTLRG